MKKNPLILCLCAYSLVIAGCAITPHVFVNTYTPEVLPEISADSGIHSLSGSAFLRQQGGGIVTCAGNGVKAKKILPVVRNDYAKEYLKLPDYVKNVTNVDVGLLDFENKLKKITDENTFTTTCDVDGKFKIDKLKSGVYDVTTSVVWVVGDSVQGGTLAKVVTIPDKTEPTITNIVLSER